MRISRIEAVAVVRRARARARSAYSRTRSEIPAPLYNARKRPRPAHPEETDVKYPNPGRSACASRCTRAWRTEAHDDRDWCGSMFEVPQVSRRNARSEQICKSVNRRATFRRSEADPREKPRTRRNCEIFSSIIHRHWTLDKKSVRRALNKPVRLLGESSQRSD